MPDLIIREVDGWEELEDVSLTFENGIDPLWTAVSRGEIEDAQTLLEDDGFDFDGYEIAAIRMVAVPDDLRGEHIRIWVKYR